jgi:hypothetical protein
MTDAYVNFPYQSWEIFPVGVNHSYYHITGGIFDITIEMKEAECSLIRPQDQPVVEDILNVWMSPDSLIQALKDVGMNFFPEPDANKYIMTLNDKVRSLEDEVYESMSMVIGGWGFQWSQWNSSASKDAIVLRVAECTSDKWTLLREDESLDQVQWDLYKCNIDSTCKLKMTEDNEEFSPEICDGHMTHPQLYTTLVKPSPLEISELASQTSPLHIWTINKWLTATRPLWATC